MTIGKVNVLGFSSKVFSLPLLDLLALASVPSHHVPAAAVGLAESVVCSRDRCGHEDPKVFLALVTAPPKLI